MKISPADAARRAGDGDLGLDELLALGESIPLATLRDAAEQLALEGFGAVVSYSRKVFIPLTRLCRDVCHYCTFATAPRHLPAPYLSPEEAISIARHGAAVGCREALFTLGDKPELRYQAARDALERLGQSTTISYLEEVARQVYTETGLLPHLNPGAMTREDLARLRTVSVSMGLMLESSSPRLCERGGPHFGSPDKQPSARFETIRLAGELAIPLTTGILVGIGETREERIQSLVSLRRLHEQFGHIQEVIVQNFRAKAATKMAAAAEPSVGELLWTIAMTRLVFGREMSIQVPPNLQRGALADVLSSGINDWGGVSAVTPDHVNPEAPWPLLDSLADETAKAGRVLVERLAIAPRHAIRAGRWVDAKFVAGVLRSIDSNGYVRDDSWSAGAGASLPALSPLGGRSLPRSLDAVMEKSLEGFELSTGEIERLFRARDAEFDAVVFAADSLRRKTVGETVTFVVNRNINYTNICLYHCGFCAFSKGRGAATLRGPAYNIDHEEIARRAVAAVEAGATEVCLQGGIHPAYTGDTYLQIVATVRSVAPALHIHAFSPLEIQYGAKTLGLSLRAYLERLQAAGLSTLPGTAAEILDDEVRDILCPDKLRTREWLETIRVAHEVGLRTTATIMFGHVDEPQHWARHLLRVRRLQLETGGITEFVPLPFVHMEAPLWRRGRCRSGPTAREAVLMHAVSRLVLHPLIPNIQTSWVKMGPDGARRCLDAGANDLGGTLMNESITRAAGGVHGQEFCATAMMDLAAVAGRPVRQRTTLYGTPGIDDPPVSHRNEVGAGAPFERYLDHVR
jgi:FO synthase